MIAAVSDLAALRKVTLDEVELGHVIVAHDIEKDTTCIFTVRHIKQYGGGIIEVSESDHYGAVYVDSFDESTHSFYVIEEAL